MTTDVYPKQRVQSRLGVHGQWQQPYIRRADGVQLTDPLVACILHRLWLHANLKHKILDPVEPKLPPLRVGVQPVLTARRPEVPHLAVHNHDGARVEHHRWDCSHPCNNGTAAMSFTFQT